MHVRLLVLRAASRTGEGSPGGTPRTSGLWAAGRVRAVCGRQVAYERSAGGPAPVGRPGLRGRPPGRGGRGHGPRPAAGPRRATGPGGVSGRGGPSSRRVEGRGSGVRGSGAAARDGAAGVDPVTTRTTAPPPRMVLRPDLQQRRRRRGQQIGPVGQAPRPASTARSATRSTSPASRASTPVASNGSRLSSRTAATAGPLTLSYAAQYAASSPRARRPGPRPEHHGLMGPLGELPRQRLEFIGRPDGPGGPGQLPSEPPRRGPQRRRRRPRVGGRVQLHRIGTEGRRRRERGRHESRGVQPAPAEVGEARRVGDPSGPYGRLGPAGVGVAAGGEASVGQHQQRRAGHQKRK